MASVHKANCPCGFSDTFGIGGTMASFKTHATFPYYCQHCGLVLVNVAPALQASSLDRTMVSQDGNVVTPTCPECGNNKVDQYGIPPASVSAPTSRLAMQAWSYKAYEKAVLLRELRQPTSELENSENPG